NGDYYGAEKAVDCAAKLIVGCADDEGPYSLLLGPRAFGCCDALTLLRLLALPFLHLAALPFSLLSVLTLGRCDSSLSLFRFPAARFRYHLLRLLGKCLLLRQHFLHLRLR